MERGSGNREVRQGGKRFGGAFRSSTSRRVRSSSGTERTISPRAEHRNGEFYTQRNAKTLHSSHLRSPSFIFPSFFPFPPHPSYFHLVPAFSAPSPSNYRKPLLSTHRNARSVCAYNGNCLRTLEYHLRDGEFNWLKSLLPLDNSWPRQRYENGSRCLENKCFLHFPLLYTMLFHRTMIENFFFFFIINIIHEMQSR